MKFEDFFLVFVSCCVLVVCGVATAVAVLLGIGFILHG